MSSSQSDRKQGAGIFVALVPWVLFTLVASHWSLKAASLLGLAGAVVIAAPSLRARRPKLIELGAVATFAGFAIVAFAADAAVAADVSRYARAIAAAVLAGLALVSLLFVPFTEEYARESVPREHWSSPAFKQGNRRLTLLWAGTFAAMVPSHLIAAAIDTRPGNLVFNWAVPVALVLFAVKRSRLAAEEAPAAAAAPVAPVTRRVASR
jgi:hypothetical protein